MKQKQLTDEGKEHKERIVLKLFYEKSTILPNSNLFMSALLLFKSFILTFEQNESHTHRLHRSHVVNFRVFFVCFMKFEVINNAPYNKLNLIDVASNVQKLKTLYVGDENEKLLSLFRERLDVCWNKVFKTNRDPVLSSLVRPCLSTFTGRMVE